MNQHDQLKFYKEQYDYQLARNKENESLLKELRTFRHDMKNHLFALYCLLKHGKTDEAIRYMEDLNDHLFPDPLLIHTGNPVFDAVVTAKLHEAANHQIQFQTDIMIPENLPMDPFDVHLFFSSLFDLLPASESVLSPVFFKVKYQKGCLLGSISGDFSITTPLPESLTDITKKYDGSLDIKKKERAAVLSFLLPLPF